MTVQEVMKELRTMGTEQNIKIYRRHGMGAYMYGVSFSHLQQLRKKIKTDHALAQQLWKTGNADARHLATMIVDPELATEGLIDRWAKALSYYLIADLHAGWVCHTPWAKKKAEEWIRTEHEWIGRAGWMLVAYIAMEKNNFSDEYFKKLLSMIEKKIHHGKNFAKHAMNNALIAIGIRNKSLKEAAQQAAKRIGKVEVDHGETNCKTPDAALYIEKVFARRR
ncbi:DNA alkylation repair protein [bacterium]|nr:DNA alkylation repair protein [bacterium]